MVEWLSQIDIYSTQRWDSLQRLDSEIKDIIPASWIRVGNYISCRIVCGFIYEDKEYKAVSNYYVLTPFQRKEDLYANVFIEQNNPTKYSIELFQEGR